MKRKTQLYKLKETQKLRDGIARRTLLLSLGRIRQLELNIDQLQAENQHLRASTTLAYQLMAKSDWEAHRERERADKAFGLKNKPVDKPRAKRDKGAG